MKYDAFEVREGIQYAMEGETGRVFTITVKTRSGNTPTLSSLSMTVYKGSTESSSTFLTGSISSSGDTITTKTFQSLVGKDMLKVNVYGSVNGSAVKGICQFWLVVVPAKA